MVAAHWMSQAIAQLHGIPDKKERCPSSEFLGQPAA